MPKTKKKFCHPNSRKAQKLSKSMTRLKRMEKAKDLKQHKLSAQVSKLMWFREMMNESHGTYEPEEVNEMIERYLHRFDDELTSILDLQKSKGALASHYRHQHAAREDWIRQTVTEERELYESTGIELPDITCPNGVLAFLNWKGEKNLLPTLTMRRYRSLAE